MSEFRFTFELNHRREKAESPGGSLFDATALRTGVAAVAGLTNTIIVCPQVGPVYQERIGRATVHVATSGAAPVVNARLTTWRNSGGYWYIELTGGAGVLVQNTPGDDSIIQQLVNGVPTEVLQLTGAAAAVVSDLPAGSLMIVTEVARHAANVPRAQTSALTVDWFADDSLDTLPNVGTVAARYLQQLRLRAGGLLPLADFGGGNRITVPSCAGAYTFGPPFIVAADVGIGNGQIPANPADWTSARFKPHPRVFLRSSAFHWQASHLYPVTTGNPTVITSDTALTPLLVARRPTHSLWRLFLEGNVTDVILAHPATGDYRRPRDIWTNVLAPRIERQGDIEHFGYQLLANNVRSFYSRGVLQNLGYLDAAICLDLLDGSSDTPVVEWPEE